MTTLNKTFFNAINAAESCFASLKTDDFLTLQQLVLEPEQAGVYVLYEGEEAVYVGRTRRIRKRIRDHLSDNHFSATFVKRLARNDWHKAHSPTKRCPTTTLLDDTNYKRFVTIRREYVSRLQIKYLPCPDPLEQYLLEAYAIVALDLGHEELKTH